MSERTFNILTIDGGGLRGIYAASILLNMEQRLGINFVDDFDLIAGTSTGAIIAAGLAIGIPAQTIVDLYMEQGAFIFKKNLFGGVVTPKYNHNNLKQVLNEVFGDKNFSDAKTRLIVTATNVSDGMPWVFKSLYHERLTRDQGVRLADAVLSSCCAPVYFNPYEVNNQLLADGGLWANNPALVALAETVGHNIDIKKYKIRILSLGSGINIKYYPLDWGEKKWGATRWGTGLIDVIFNMQSFSVEKYLGALMNTDQYLRINFEIEDGLPIDDTKTTPILMDKGAYDFYKNEVSIKDLLGKSNEKGNTRKRSKKGFNFNGFNV